MRPLFYLFFGCLPAVRVIGARSDFGSAPAQKNKPNRTTTVRRFPLEWRISHCGPPPPPAQPCCVSGNRRHPHLPPKILHHRDLEMSKPTAAINSFYTHAPHLRDSAPGQHRWELRQKGQTARPPTPLEGNRNRHVYGLYIRAALRLLPTAFASPFFDTTLTS